MLRLSLLLLLMAEVATCCAPHSPTRSRPKQQDMDVSPEKPLPSPPPTTTPSTTPAAPAMPSTATTMSTTSTTTTAAPAKVCAAPDAISEEIPGTLPNGSKQPTTDNGEIKCGIDTPLIFVRKNGREIVRASEVKCTKLQWVATSEDGREMFNATQVSCAAPLPKGCPELGEITQGELNMRFPEMGKASKPMVTMEGAVCQDANSRLFFTDSVGNVLGASAMACRNQQWIVLGNRHIPLAESTKVACAQLKCAPLGAITTEEIKKVDPEYKAACSMPTVNEHGVVCKGPIENLFFTSETGEIESSNIGEIDCMNEQWFKEDQMLNDARVCCIDSPRSWLSNECPALDRIEQVNLDMLFEDANIQMPIVKDGSASCSGATPTLYYFQGHDSLSRATRMDCYAEQWYAVTHAGNRRKVNPKVICSD